MDSSPDPRHTGLTLQYWNGVPDLQGSMVASGLISRWIEQPLLEQLDRFPAVALLGPRQVGKTTLARQIAQSRQGLVLDLESPAAAAGSFCCSARPQWS
jgi:hypothetical protein